MINSRRVYFKNCKLPDVRNVPDVIILITRIA